MVSRFGVVLIAVDDYPDPPGPLPSSHSARRFGALLGGVRGGRVVDTVLAGGEQEVVDAVRRWASTPDRPAASVVYLVGHGRGDGLDHDFLVPAGDGTASVRTNRLAEFLQRDWQRRQLEPGSWALLVLDCCDSELGVTNLVAELTAKYPKKPKRLGLWPVAPGGASRSGAFVAAFERALDTFTENDERIPLDEVFRRIRGELGDLEPAGFLPDEAALDRPGPAAPVVMALDVHEELRLALAGRPPEVRSHFLAKAQGSEVGEVAWHFTGRDQEVAQLCDWLHQGSGMKVVTGEAGSGKSALLGHLVVLADPALVSLYAESGLAPQLAAGPRPPDHAFGAVLHLTGKTAIEAVDDIALQLGHPEPGVDGDGSRVELQARIGDLVDRIRTQQQHGTTVLVDALDEAQAPKAIASLLREVSADGYLRVLVGTRRSVSEGPDQPADATRRDLLDTLRAADDDLLVVERDPGAVRAYAEQRLWRDGSPYAERPDHAAALAARIAARDQPFLFARLATAELLARPALDPDDPTLTELLRGGHRGVFAAALDRIATVDPTAVDMLCALAHARGRGVPRTGGIWVDAARAVGSIDDASDERVDATVAVAGPYVTLDAEAGQSTYRLAHQTFVEHFHAQPRYGEGHRRIAAAMAKRYRSAEDGWAGANHYAVRYLVEHLVADADRTPPDADGLVELVTDAGWLVRAVELLGVDRTVELIASARAIIDQLDMVTWAFTHRPVDAVERTLRRSRIALARDLTQLPGLVHARLKDDANDQLATLGDAIGAVTGRAWLRMVEGRLDWASDIESTYGLVGKVRGLGFGHIDERPVVAVAVDTRVVLWDPRQGVPDDAGAIETDHRPTAVAMATIDGRPVVVTSAGYDSTTAIWDARTGDRLASSDVALGHAVAVGRVGDHLLLAGASPNGEVSFLDATSMEPVEAAPGLRARHVRGFGVDEGHLLALAVESEQRRAGPGSAPGESVHRILVVDPSDGREVWRSIALTGEEHERIDAVAGGRIGPAFVVVAGIGRRTHWLTERNGHIEQSPHSQRLRSLAVGLVDGRPIVVSSPDYDATALVQIHQVDYEQTADGVTLFRPRAIEGSLPSPERFGAVPLPPKLREPHPDDKVRSFSMDRPEEWPHSAATTGELGGSPILVTGSVEGAVWVWDIRSDRPRALAGPFVRVSPYTLERGWESLFLKPGVPTANSVALGHHPDHGLVVAVSCDGAVRVYTVPGGQRIEGPADEATVVDAVALGSLNGRDVLVTGSKGGVLVVWGLAGAKRVAAITLDDPVTDVRIEPGADSHGHISVRTGAQRDFLVELVEP